NANAGAGGRNDARSPGPPRGPGGGGGGGGGQQKGRPQQGGGGAKTQMQGELKHNPFAALVRK
ncbi:MAG TPA: hypothetical protein VK459_21985, partial [Polyangiaceae bacterium]|nr:hypothetical protein [Polyangiaceae bacterium]